MRALDRPTRFEALCPSGNPHTLEVTLDKVLDAEEDLHCGLHGGFRSLARLRAYAELYRTDLNRGGLETVLNGILRDGWMITRP